MSGHSKWHNIQARKGKQDAKKGNLFSKFAKKIAIAAKSGGNPETNFSLRLVIDKAKAVGMPKDNIDRAIKAGTGELKDAAQVEELMYEGFGPGGAAILIKILTDNKNRTAPEIKRILSDRGGSMGGAGSVQWMFESRGVIRYQKSNSKACPREGGDQKLSDDELQMALIEAGAEDIYDEQDGVEIQTKPENLQNVLNKMKELGAEIESSGLEWVAKNRVTVAPETQEKLMRLFEELDAHDDVEDYFTNAE